jgi:hypothetical protein
MTIINVSGTQIDVDNIDHIQEAGGPGRTNIFLREPSGSVTVPLAVEDVMRLVSEAKSRS